MATTTINYIKIVSTDKARLTGGLTPPIFHENDRINPAIGQDYKTFKKCQVKKKK